MARHLIQNAATGDTRIVGDAALPFFPGYVIRDTLDDGQPPFTFPTIGEGDLRYVNVTELSDPASAASVALKAAFVARGVQNFVAKPAGNTDAGVLDWINQATVGHLLHLRAGAGSGSKTFGLAIGTDQGDGNGLLVSHKNLAVGVQVISHPGANTGIYGQGFSTGYLASFDVHRRSGALMVSARKGEGFKDGATTSGSTTFTSATAAFTSGDVGATLEQTGSRGLTDIGGAVPTGTTITAVLSATQVSMSAPAAATASAIMFMVGGRVPLESQTLMAFRDHDDAPLLKITRGGTTLTSAAGQTGDVLGVFLTGNVTGALRVTKDGLVAAGLGQRATNAGKTDVSPLSVQNYGTAVATVGVIAVAGQTADQLALFASDAATRTSRFNKDGYFMTRKTAAPADTDIGSSEGSLWWDPTPGTGGWRYKGKASDGSVLAGSL